jgi:hypothetical protein
VNLFYITILGLGFIFLLINALSFIGGIMSFSDGEELEQAPRWLWAISLQIFAGILVFGISSLFLPWIVSFLLLVMGLGMVTTPLSVLYSDNKSVVVTYYSSWFHGDNDRGFRILSYTTSGPRMRFPWEKNEGEFAHTTKKFPLELEIESSGTLFKVPGSVFWVIDLENLKLFLEKDLESHNNCIEIVQKAIEKAVGAFISDLLGNKTSDFITGKDSNGGESCNQ